MPASTFQVQWRQAPGIDISAPSQLQWESGARWVVVLPLRSDGVSPGEFPLTDARAESEAETFLLQLEGDDAIRPGTIVSSITLGNDDSQPVLAVSIDEAIDPADRVLLLSAELSVSDRYLRSEDMARARVVLLRQDGLDPLALGELFGAMVDPVSDHQPLLHPPLRSASR